MTQRSLRLARQGWFYTGGQTIHLAGGTAIHGQMYVEEQVPDPTTALPIVLIHGLLRTGTDWTGTADGRSGWRDVFLRAGHPVYVVDQPGRGRSAYHHSLEPDQRVPVAERAEARWTAPPPDAWPQAPRHSQWPGSGQLGDPAFNQFLAAAHPSVADMAKAEELLVVALLELLERIGPAVIVTHSQSGPSGWRLADERPDLVRALIALEPSGPPFKQSFPTAGDLGGSFDRPWGITYHPLRFEPPVHDAAELGGFVLSEPERSDLWPCIALSGETGHRLPNMARVPLLIVTAEASYHAAYDHCTVSFLRRFRVDVTHLRLEEAGLRGNGHMLMQETNSDEIARLLLFHVQRMTRTNDGEESRRADSSLPEIEDFE